MRIDPERSVTADYYVEGLSQYHRQATDVQLQKMAAAEHAETHAELKMALKHWEHRYLKEDRSH